MLRKPLLLIFCLFIIHYSQAQTQQISGTVKDTLSNDNLKNTVVALFSLPDSILQTFTRTDNNGHYSLPSVKPGNYYMMVMHPKFADFIDNIKIAPGTSKLPMVALTPKSKLLEAIILKSGSPMKIKGDTTIYTADSFKVSANANVEELLKKLPGIQVDKNGDIKAMGQKVEKVLVDGEEFFGDDPGMAVKNLRADAVKEVQVFDKKSDQAEFTGIDDGNTKKTINLKLKEDKKRGYFGKADAAGGPLKGKDPRYNSNLMLSSFKGKRKISGFFLNGNTGQDGLSWQDNEKFGGNDDMTMNFDDDGGFMYMFRGGSSDDEPYINTDNGFIKNTNAGISYSNKWNNKTTLNFSPKYNSQVYDNTVGSLQQTFYAPDSVFSNNSTKVSHINRYNFKNSGTLDFTIDSSNSIKLTVKGNIYHTESDETTQSATLSNTLTNKNAYQKQTQNEYDKQSFSTSLLFKHKFKKARRTLSINTDWNLLATDGTGFAKSTNLFYDHGNLDSTLLIDQKNNSDKQTQRLGVKATYTEPLSKNYSLEISHEVSLNTGKNNQFTYNYTAGTGKYDEVVDSLSNNFKQNIITNKPSFKINYSTKKIKFNFGSGFGITNYTLKDITEHIDYDRNYTNFYPSASFNYMYKSNHNLRLNYYGNTTQPTINQLQPIVNNNDNFNIVKGNPDLKPSFSNSINLMHNGYNFLKDIWTYQSLNFRTVSNSITYDRSINPSTGQTISTPINSNGNYNVSFWGGVGFKVKKIDTRFNISPNFNYNQSADILNSIKTTSKTTSTGLGLYISKAKDKKYDLSISNNFSYNNTKSSQNGKSDYSTNSLGFNGTVYYKKVWSINTDYMFNVRQKINPLDQNLNNHLWNARLQRTFKNDEFTAYVLVRDILNQNIGVDRSYYGNQYNETRSERLKRYAMIGFAWNFKNKAPKAK